MTDYKDSYEGCADRFGAVVGAGEPGTWGSPSPCESWSAADLVDHVVDTQRDFLIREGFDVGARADGDPAAVWRAHRAGVAGAIGDGSVLAREYDGYFGRTTIGDTLANFYGFDMVVHPWDLGRALGHEVRFTEEEMDRLETAIAGFGDMLYSEGVCKPAVPAPPGASRQARLLATMGRDPGRTADRPG